MGRRYTTEEDRWLVEFGGGAISECLLAQDIGRSKESIKRRISFLKKSGAWVAFVDVKKAELKAETLAGRLDPDMLEVIHGYKLEDL